MKILHVTGSMQPAVGGTSQAIRNLVSGLALLGVESEVACVDGVEALATTNDDFEVHFLGPAITSWHYSHILEGWLDFNLERFDVIIIHGSWLYPGLAAYKAWTKWMNSIARSQKSIRFYMMPHGMLDPYFQSAKGRKLKAMRNWLYWKLVEGSQVNAADGLLFTCGQELEAARHAFSPYKPKSTMVAGLGIPEPPAFEPAMQHAFEQQFPQVAGEPYFLFLSRIHEKKGLEVLLDAYSQLRKRHAGLARLVIAGPGLDCAYGHSIVSQVMQSPLLRDQVVFTGMLSGAVKWAALYGCEAFMLPSHQENFGIAIVEALACGRPVIISDKVNIWQEATTYGGGLAAPDRVEDYLAVWDEFIGFSPARKRKMAQAAVQTYQQQFALKAAARQFLSCVVKGVYQPASAIRD